MRPSRSVSEAIKDPGAAAARGRWLARGAWLLAAAEVVLAVRNHITGRLTEKERKRMLEIVRSSKGRPSNLSDRERKELRSLLDRVEPRELAKTVASSGFAGRFAKGIRRRQERPPRGMAAPGCRAVYPRVPAGEAEGNPFYGEGKCRAARSSPRGSRGGCPPCA